MKRLATSNLKPLKFGHKMAAMTKAITKRKGVAAAAAANPRNPNPPR
jgi:hypothetical protein